MGEIDACMIVVGEGGWRERGAGRLRNIELAFITNNPPTIHTDNHVQRGETQVFA